VKIGICSDSHDNLANLEKAMREFARHKVEAVLHAGDFVAPFTVDAMKLAGCPVFGVFGNCDGERPGLAERVAEELKGEVNREPHLYELGGKRFVMMHHPEWVDAFARPELADVVIHGHTHELRVETRDGSLVLNPGEVFGRLSAGASIVVYDTDTGEPEVIWLNDLPNGQ
jgi:putative phosphoesterase